MQIQRFHQNNETTFILNGRLTFADHNLFKDVLRELEAGAVRQVTLDLTHLEFIDSAGLGLFLLARDKSQSGKISLILAHPKNQVKKIFDLSQFGQLFTLKE